MDYKDYKPADTYEGLRIQFNALKQLLNSQHKELNALRNKDYLFNAERISYLESLLKSEIAANEALTDMIESKDDNQKES